MSRILKRVFFSAFTAGVLVALLLASADLPGDRRDASAGALGIHKIRHVVIVMQENRSFDSYFGTYPGADGIPGLAGNPGPVPCLPDPVTRVCVRPYHDTANRNAGGPHTTTDADIDINGGLMDGFEARARYGRTDACTNVDDPNCSLTPATPDVMGYHDWHEIPNYWAYAKHFVLQDRMFESVDSWSLPAHTAIVSAWSAVCTKHRDPMSCTTALHGPFGATGDHEKQDFPWTDVTFLLHRYGISWRYYIGDGKEPDCERGQMFCSAVSQSASTPGIWNPLPRFDTVRNDGQRGNIVPLSEFYAAARLGTLPKVSWVVPAQGVSEHPPALVSAGQRYVTGLIDAVMRGPEWDSTAIFLAWDDWGGFYDHVQPPSVDGQGYGMRVPGLVISAYAKRGYVDHQTLSFDAYLKFIEDDFLYGRRIDPATDGRPDSRPGVAENASILGDLTSDFDFSQKPRPPLILPLNPPFS